MVKTTSMLSAWSCFVLLFTISILVDGVSSTKCRENEKQALLLLKESFVDPDNSLSSWASHNCCNWRGVSCSEKTGDVITLNLSNYFDSIDYHAPLGGVITRSLLDLKHLRHLDLSYNSFEGSIPHFIGSLRSLRSLDLTRAGFNGIIPPQLGNLTNLRYLSLRPNSIGSLLAYNLQWLSHLSFLQYLDMSATEFIDTNDMVLVFTSLPSLSVLKLSLVRPFAIPQSVPYSNLSSFTKLDLSMNSLPDSKIPEWLFNITSLEELDLEDCNIQGLIPDAFGIFSYLKVLYLGGNNFQGVIPRSIGNLCRLQTLNLYSSEIDANLSDFCLSLKGCARDSLQILSLEENRLSGSLPDWFGQFRNLRKLILNDNNLNGSVPESLGNLSKLIILDLRSNSIQGVISDAHFANLTSLEALFLSPNPMVLNFTSTFVPPFQLKNIRLGSCQLGPRFPSWLQTQREFSILDISNAEISDTVPDWFWNLSSRVYYLNVSHNQLRGEVPMSLSATIIDLRSNYFQGKLPQFHPHVSAVFLSNNLFSGDLQPILNVQMPFLYVLALSGNILTGKIPSSLCDLKTIMILDLSNNLLSGEIPNCTQSPPQLSVMSLASNNLSGSIPDWIGSLYSLLSLHLSDNSLRGKIPSLRNCTKLLTLDLEHNKMTGSIPTWIGESLSSLLILSLRSNHFDGVIPPQLSNLSSLQVLDLAHNHLSGSIPDSFNNFSAMAEPNKTIERIIIPYSRGAIVDYEMVYLDISFEETLQVVTKGTDINYSSILSLVMSLDLSYNDLFGEIPEGLMDLIGLQSLNLSWNQLTGNIPERIGGLESLETLDLSMNRLSGAIPVGMTALTLLSHLNLSYNNLSGTIPTGNQIQTLTDPSMYYGNEDLCGFPLPKCQGKEPSTVPFADNEKINDLDMMWFYISLGIGYVVGFWVACGVLLFKSSWRFAYFQFFDDMIDWIYVTIALKMRRLQV